MIGVDAVIGTVDVPSLNDPDVVVDFRHEPTAGFVYGQYWNGAYGPVGTAAIAELDDTATAPIATAATNNGRNDFLITDLTVELNLTTRPLRQPRAWDS
jgi:hypothetical protein